MSKKHPLTLSSGGVPSSSTGSGTGLLEMVKGLPPEAIIKVFDIVGDVVRTNADVYRDNQAFLNDLDRLRETNAGVERRLEFLRSMVLSGQLSEVAQLRLVDAICEVVVK